MWTLLVRVSLGRLNRWSDGSLKGLEVAHPRVIVLLRRCAIDE